LAQEPASYRAGSASFDLNAGSALKAILPGAFQGAVVGSLLVTSWYIGQAFFIELAFDLTNILSAIMAFCFAMLVATAAGTVLCALAITVVGLPLALVMRRHIARPAMLGLSVAVSLLAGLAVTQMLTASILVSPGDEALIALAVLAYAIPAGVFYRRAIITERLLSFWGDRE
jgi:hypothetical protein